MSLTPPELGLILIALSATAYLLGKFRTLSSIGIFLGILLAGINGHVIAFAGRLLAILARLTSTVFVWAFGATAAAAGLAILAVLIFVMVHDWMPRNAAKKRTFWISAAMGLIIAAGATGVAALNNLPGGLQASFTQVTSPGSGTGLGG